jgi:Lrp/AsnC family leucine-responsive transcriptional regulator
MDFEFEKLLDRTGRLILNALQENARLTFSELGRLVGLTSPAVGERVRRLEEAQIIRGYYARISVEKSGYPIQAFIRLQTPAAKYPRVLATAQNRPEVLECHHITGEEAFMMRVVATSTQHLEEIIAAFSPFGETSTSIILSTPVEKHLRFPG